MAHLQFVDELVREYLLYRGFTNTLKAFDHDLKSDKEKGFRVDKVVEQILQYINTSDLNGLREYWSHLDNFVFSKLEIHFQPVVRKIEYSLFKYYLVTACQGPGGVKSERVSEFLSKMLPELQGQNEWRDWFMLPYIQKPEDHLSFSLFFTKTWQDSLLVSLHNLLATVFQCMPPPTLTSYEGEAVMMKRLQDEVAALKLQGKVSSQAAAASPGSAASRERLSGPAPLVDDFSAAGADADCGVREARGLRSLIRQMGGSPVMAKKNDRKI